MFSKFLSRESFDYDIDILDKTLQTEDFPFSFLLYQESIMQILQLAGIPNTKSYEVIKSISKKNKAKIDKEKDDFIRKFSQKLLEVENKK